MMPARVWHPIDGALRRRGYTPDPGAPANPRDELVYDEYEPSLLTTGTLPDIERTDYNTGSQILTITKPNTILKDLNIWGDIRIQTSGVRIENCRLYGGLNIPTGQTGIIDANSLAAVDLIVRDCEIAAQTPSYYRDGIIGHKFKAFRNYIHNVNDGIGAYAHPNDSTGIADVEIAGNYIRDLVFWKNDPAHTDGTHNDCVQLQGGKNIWVHGNNLVGSSVDAPGSSNPDNTALYPGNPRTPYLNGQCIIIGQTSSIAKYENCVVENNWLYMGSVQLAINLNSSVPPLSATVRNNKFGRDIYTFSPSNPDRRWIALTGRSGLSIIGLDTNRFQDTGAVLVEGRATGIRIISE